MILDRQYFKISHIRRRKAFSFRGVIHSLKSEGTNLRETHVKDVMEIVIPVRASKSKLHKAIASGGFLRGKGSVLRLGPSKIVTTEDGRLLA